MFYWYMCGFYTVTSSLYDSSHHVEEKGTIFLNVIHHVCLQWKMYTLLEDIVKLCGTLLQVNSCSSVCVCACTHSLYVNMQKSDSDDFFVYFKTILCYINGTYVHPALCIIFFNHLDNIYKAQNITKFLEVIWLPGRLMSRKWGVQVLKLNCVTWYLSVVL